MIRANGEKLNMNTQEVKGIFHFYEFLASPMSVVSLADVTSA